LIISAKMSVIFAAIFAAVCFTVAIDGFVALGDVADPAARADGQGFAWFWTFLGVVAVAFGALGVWMVKTQKDGENA